MGSNEITELIFICNAQRRKILGINLWCFCSHFISLGPFALYAFSELGRIEYFKKQTKILL